MNSFAFILSFSRSGSTLLASILNSHNNINVLNETWIFPTAAILGWSSLDYNKQRYILHLYNKSIKTVKSQKKISTSICQNKNISLESFYKKIHSSKSKILAEKNPANTIHSSFLINSFKGSKFIFLTRNPLDIASSYKKRWHSNSTSDEFVFRVALVIKSYFFHAKKNLSRTDIQIIKFENLVDFTEKTVKKICKIIGVDFNKKMLQKLHSFDFDFESKKFHKNLSKSINTKNTSNYKIDLSKKEISELSFLFRDIIGFFNYPTVKFEQTEKLLKIEKKINRIIKSKRSNFKILQKKIIYNLYYFNFIIKINWKEFVKHNFLKKILS